MRRSRLLQGLLALLLLAGASCQSVRSPASPVVVKRSQMLMGTLVFVTAVAPDETIAAEAAARAFAELKRLETLWSTWIASSDVSRVNQAAGRKAVKVSAETIDLIKWSLRIGRLTDGAFNIAIGPAVSAWSVTEQERIPSEDELSRVRPLVDLNGIHVEERAQAIFLAKPGMQLDVGGIGKGLAADYAVEAMKRAGATAGVVALSGDIKTFGRLPGGAGFLFGIQHPRDEQALLGTIALRDEAISTAGDYERFFERDGVRYHHILDPRSLTPARACQSVTVVAKDGVMADGLDTAIFVMGPKRGMELVERLPDVEAVIVDAEGQVLLSSGLIGRLSPDHRP